MAWSILDALDDRAALNVITALLDDSINLPMGNAGDAATRRMLSARLKKIALACDVDKITTSTTIDMNQTVGAKLSETKPGAIDIVKLKEIITTPLPEPPRFVECALLEGLKDDDGNPAAFMINTAAMNMPTMVCARTPGKTQNLVLMTPEFAVMVAAEAKKHSIKILIEGHKD